jgi:uncharacterized protein YcbX
MARLARINVTPVKGTALHHPGRIELTPTGLAENRRFLLIDERDELFSGYDLGTLVQIDASYGPATESLRLAFPDGSHVEGLTDRLSARTVTDNSGRPVAGHIVEGPFSEAFTSFAGSALRLVKCDLPGEGSDVHHLSMVSSASVARLGAQGGHDGLLDARRFRMDLEIDETEPYEEDSWSSQRVAVGPAIIKVLGQIPRCRVTTQDPDTGIRDWPTLTEIAKQRPRSGGVKIPFGMYAEVETPGSIAIGDVVSLLTDAPAGTGAQASGD